MKIQNINTIQSYKNNTSIKQSSMPNFSGLQKTAQNVVESSIDAITEPSSLKTLWLNLLSKFQGKEQLMVSKEKVNIGIFKAPKNLTNHIGNINIKQGVNVKGCYDAGGSIVSNGALAKSGSLNAGGNILVIDAPSVAGKIISKGGDVHITAKSIDGVDIEGRCVSIQSNTNRVEHQALIKAKEDVHIFAPLEASMISGDDVKIYSDAHIKDSFISGKKVFINSRLESTTISARVLELGENTKIGKNVKLIADEIIDNR